MENNRTQPIAHGERLCYNAKEGMGARPMKRLMAILLGLMLLLSVASAETRHEGTGYDTPEDAVLAYVEALNRGDVDDMLATFALESFADHCDPDAFLVRMRAFNPATIGGVPVNGAYARSLLVNARYAQIANVLMQQYMEISAALEGMMVPLEDSEARAEMEARFANSPLNAWAGNAQFVNWINPALVEEKIALPMNLANSTLQTAYYGADDIDWKVAHLTLGGAQAVLFMQCVKYGDRWYNGELSGLPGAILGLPFNSAGMVVEGVTDYGVDLSALNNPLALLTQTEGTRLFNANAKSDLAGTRWQLERVEGADVAVKADAGAAAQDGGRGAWVELHFTRLGALLDTRLSPELAQAMEVDTRVLTGMAWRESNGALEVLMLNWRGAGIDTEGCRLERSGDALTLTTGNGIALVFRRI